jgi:hypothetical protein
MAPDVVARGVGAAVGTGVGTGVGTEGSAEIAKLPVQERTIRGIW